MYKSRNDSKWEYIYIIFDNEVASQEFDMLGKGHMVLKYEPLQCNLLSDIRMIYYTHS